MLRLVLPERIELSTSPLPRGRHTSQIVTYDIRVPQKPEHENIALFLVFRPLAAIF